MARRLPQRSRGSMALALNALLGLLALGLAFAPDGEGAPQLRLASASGALTLANSKEGQAIFQPGELRPGQQASGSVTITNTGTVNAALTLQPETSAAGPEKPGVGGGKLSNKLELLVIDVTLPNLPVTVYEGTVKQMDATNVGSLEPHRSRTYVFVASMRPQGASDNAYQGAEFSTGFRWNATGTAAPTPTTTPSPTATPTPAATPEPPAPDATPAPTAPPTAGSGATPTGDPGAGADPTGELLGAQVFALPAATRACVSRRRFAIHLRRPRGMAFTSITVTVNRRTKVRLKGARARRVKATVNLKGLPAGKVTVKITAVMSIGRKAVSTRTYRTCAAKKAKTKLRKKQRRR